MSTMYGNKVQELNVGSGVHIPGHIIKTQSHKSVIGAQTIATNADGVTLETFTFRTTVANSVLHIHYHSGQIQRQTRDMNAYMSPSVNSTARHGGMAQWQDHDHYFYGHETSLSGDHRAFNVGFGVSYPLPTVGDQTIRMIARTYNGSAVFNYQSTGTSGGQYPGRGFTVIIYEVAP